MKTYQIPIEEVELPIAPGVMSKRPKYIHELKANWTGVIDEKKGVYLCQVEAKDTAEYAKLEANNDVKLFVEKDVDNFFKGKDKLDKTKLKVGKWQP